jgi:predicted dehydrogenase
MKEVAMKRVSPIVLSRRGMIQTSGIAVVSSALGSIVGACARPDRAAAQGSEGTTPVKLPGLLGPTERESDEMPAPWPDSKRIRFAIVGLGRLTLDRILPSFASSTRCKVTALVSGDRAKALHVAAQYGVRAEHLYDYETYDRLREDDAVDVVYIVLPNSMHAEYTVRAAKAGKHVLCEKPMATSVSDCQQMIDACAQANKKLMIGYRMQYEPYNREVIRLARAGMIGALKSFVSTNGQTQGDANQWRLKKAMSGGGPLPDMGIYCLNAARYISGEEPVEIQAIQFTSPNDPRFVEVEEIVSFTMRFPSGFLASCSTSYGFHDSKQYRLCGAEGWIDLDPAYPYSGQTMRVGRKESGSNVEGIERRELASKNQFALEMDHMASCVVENRKPHTPGEEGMQDMKIIASIYDAARSGSVVKLPPAAGLDVYRGPPLDGKAT